MKNVFKSYLLGWAVGWETEDGKRFEVEERGPLGIYYSKVFPTRAAATAAARGLLQESRRVYVRAYAYETPNPENARGLPLLDTVENRFEWVGNPEN